MGSDLILKVLALSLEVSGTWLLVCRHGPEIASPRAFGRHNIREEGDEYICAWCLTKRALRSEKKQ